VIPYGTRVPVAARRLRTAIRVYFTLHSEGSLYSASQFTTVTVHICLLEYEFLCIFNLITVGLKLFTAVFGRNRNVRSWDHTVISVMVRIFSAYH